jgi:hypothetical protein
MVKARTIYIWEGADAITITRGTSLQSYVMPDGNVSYQMMIKHKGLFKKYFPVRGINQMYVMPATKYFDGVNNKAGWEVVVLRMDYASKVANPYGVPAGITSRYEALLNDCNSWRAKYFDLKKKLEDFNQKDKLQERVKKDFKFASDVRGMLYADSGFGGGWYGGFANRFGLQGAGSQQQSGSGE